MTAEIECPTSYGRLEMRLIDRGCDRGRDIVEVADRHHRRSAVSREVEHEQLSTGIALAENREGWEPHPVVERQAVEQDERRPFILGSLRPAVEPRRAEGFPLRGERAVLRHHRHDWHLHIGTMFRKGVP